MDNNTKFTNYPVVQIRVHVMLPCSDGFYSSVFSVLSWVKICYFCGNITLEAEDCFSKDILHR